MRCHRCGHRNPEGSRFCVDCGAALARDQVANATGAMPANVGEKPELPPQAFAPPPTQAHPKAVEPLPAGAALLVVKRGPAAESRFVLDQPVITVGRQQDNDLVLDDVTVSRRHAEFHRRDQGFLVRDVGSLNGTYVNREPVAEASLVSGDEVQIGKFLLLYLTESPCDGTRRSLSWAPAADCWRPPLSPA